MKQSKHSFGIIAWILMVTLFLGIAPFGALAEEAVEAPLETIEAIDTIEAIEAPAAEDIAEDVAVEGTDEQAAETVPEITAQEAERVPADALSRVESYFGADVVAGYEEFYTALYSAGLARSGMALTITVPNLGMEYFDGSLFSFVQTESSGSVSSSVALPAHYQVTYAVKTEGRVPGTYTATVQSFQVWDTRLNRDMSSMFSPVATGGQLVIDGTGSLLMIEVADIEVPFTGKTQQAEATTGEVFINWDYMSSELELVVSSTAEILYGTKALQLQEYAILVKADGTDITEYFEYQFDYPGQVTVTEPEEIHLEPINGWCQVYAPNAGHAKWTAEPYVEFDTYYGNAAWCDIYVDGVLLEDISVDVPCSGFYEMGKVTTEYGFTWAVIDYEITPHFNESFYAIQNDRYYLPFLTMFPNAEITISDMIIMLWD